MTYTYTRVWLCFATYGDKQYLPSGWKFWALKRLIWNQVEKRIIIKTSLTAVVHTYDAIDISLDNLAKI